MAGGKNVPGGYLYTLQEVKDELKKIVSWSSAPHKMADRERRRPGQIEADFDSLSNKLNALRSNLARAQQAKLDACAEEVTAAFGGVIMHTQAQYKNELNEVRGWSEFWRSAHKAIKGLNAYVATLPAKEDARGRQSGGTAGGPRSDLSGHDLDCA